MKPALAPRALVLTSERERERESDRPAPETSATAGYACFFSETPGAPSEVTARYPVPRRFTPDEDHHERFLGGGVMSGGDWWAQRAARSGRYAPPADPVVSPDQAAPAMPSTSAARRCPQRSMRKGQNGCKGQGGCKTDKNACKGHGNTCKGNGGRKTTLIVRAEAPGSAGRDGGRLGDAPRKREESTPSRRHVLGPYLTAAVAPTKPGRVPASAAHENAESFRSYR
jgi:hypothetical protein